MDQVEIQEDSFSSDEDFDEQIDEEEDSESSTDVDEKIKNEEIFDRDFLKCYSALKRKDSKIYDKDVKFFNVEKTDAESKDESSKATTLLDNKKISKPKMTVLDHQLSLKDDEVIEDLHRDRMDDETVLEKTKPMLSHYERELDDIKKEIIQVAGSDSDSDDNDFLIRKGQSAEPVKGTRSSIESIPDDDDQDIKELKTLWSDPKRLSDEDKFLRDYIINKRYITSEETDQRDGGFFSKDIDKLSDIEGDDEKDQAKKRKKIAKATYHSDELHFDKIKRIPRNATQTIRDLNEKKLKKEKRLKKIEKRKKLRKKMLEEDEEEEEFRYQEGKPDEEELKKIMEEIDMELKGTKKDKQSAGAEPDGDVEQKKKKKKKKRGGQKNQKVGVAPDRLLSYGISKRKLKKSKLLP